MKLGSEAQWCNQHTLAIVLIMNGGYQSGIGKTIELPSIQKKKKRFWT